MNLDEIRNLLAEIEALNDLETPDDQDALDAIDRELYG